jgi:tetratricopeptide (TPR) repeat protein
MILQSSRNSLRSAAFKAFAFILLGCLLGQNANAQMSKVTSAYNMYTLGKLPEARQAIDIAATHPDSKDKTKTSYYRGLIYLESFEKSDKKSSAFLDTAYKALMRAKASPKKEYNDEITQVLPTLYNSYFFAGQDKYKAKNYAGAVADFERVIEMKLLPVDTAALEYTASAAMLGKDYKKANAIFQIMHDSKIDNSSTYPLWSGVRMEMTDTAGAFEVLKLGRQRRPNDMVILNEMINYFIRTRQLKEAYNLIEKAIAQNPKSPVYQLIAGQLAEKSDDLPKAEAYYKRAVADSANYFDANYGLGALYFNEGVAINSAANDLPVSKAKEYEIKKAESRAAFKKALPYMETAAMLDPKSMEAAHTLFIIYAQLGNQAKSNEWKAKEAEIRNN